MTPAVMGRRNSAVAAVEQTRLVPGWHRLKNQNGATAIFEFNGGICRVGRLLLPIFLFQEAQSGRGHPHLFSRSLIDLIRGVCGDAVAFLPNCPDLFFVHRVVEHVDWREDWKGLFVRPSPSPPH